MAIVACEDCGAEISTSAKVCPKCGAEVPRPQIWPWIIGIPFALWLALLAYWMATPEYENRAIANRLSCEENAREVDPFNVKGLKLVCDSQYVEAMERGRIAASKK